MHRFPPATTLRTLSLESIYCWQVVDVAEPLSAANEEAESQPPAAADVSPEIGYADSEDVAGGMEKWSTKAVNALERQLMDRFGFQLGAVAVEGSTELAYGLSSRAAVEIVNNVKSRGGTEVLHSLVSRPALLGQALCSSMGPDDATLIPNRSRAASSFADMTNMASDSSREEEVALQLLYYWLVQRVVTRLLQIALPEQLFLRRTSLPGGIVATFLGDQEHFSLKRLLSSLVRTQSYTKVIVHSRTSADIRALPVNQQYAATEQDLTAKGTVVPDHLDPRCLKIYKLEQFRTQDDFTGMLTYFYKQSATEEYDSFILLILADMQECSHDRINFARLMIDQHDAQQSTQLDGAPSERRKLCTLLLHKPGNHLFGNWYPTIFLGGWEHVFLDAITDQKLAVSHTVNVSQWMHVACGLSKGAASSAFYDALYSYLPEALLFVPPRVQFPKSALSAGRFNRANISDDSGIESRAQRHEMLKFIMEQEVSDDGRTFGRMLCEMFTKEWTHKRILDNMKRAADRTAEQALNLLESLEDEFKELFHNFLTKVIPLANRQLDLDVFYRLDSISTAEHRQLLVAFGAGFEAMDDLPRFDDLKEGYRREIMLAVDGRDAICSQFPLSNQLLKAIEALCEQVAAEHHRQKLKLDMESDTAAVTTEPSASSSETPSVLGAMRARILGPTPSTVARDSKRTRGTAKDKAQDKAKAPQGSKEMLEFERVVGERIASAGTGERMVSDGSKQLALARKLERVMIEGDGNATGMDSHLWSRYVQDYVAWKLGSHLSVTERQVLALYLQRQAGLEQPSFAALHVRGRDPANVAKLGKLLTTIRPLTLLAETAMARLFEKMCLEPQKDELSHIKEQLLEAITDRTDIVSSADNLERWSDAFSQLLDLMQGRVDPTEVHQLASMLGMHVLVQALRESEQRGRMSELAPALMRRLRDHPDPSNFSLHDMLNASLAFFEGNELTESTRTSFVIGVLKFWTSTTPTRAQMANLSAGDKERTLLDVDIIARCLNSEYGCAAIWPSMREYLLKQLLNDDRKIYLNAQDGVVVKLASVLGANRHVRLQFKPRHYRQTMPNGPHLACPLGYAYFDCCLAHFRSLYEESDMENVIMGYEEFSDPERREQEEEQFPMQQYVLPIQEAAFQQVLIEVLAATLARSAYSEISFLSDRYADELTKTINSVMRSQRDHVFHFLAMLKAQLRETRPVPAEDQESIFKHGPASETAAMEFVIRRRENLKPFKSWLESDWKNIFEKQLNQSLGKETPEPWMLSFMLNPHRGSPWYTASEIYKNLQRIGNTPIIDRIVQCVQDSADQEADNTRMALLMYIYQRFFGQKKSSSQLAQALGGPIKAALQLSDREVALYRVFADPVNYMVRKLETYHQQPSLRLVEPDPGNNQIKTDDALHDLFDLDLDAGDATTREQLRHFLVNLLCIVVGLPVRTEAEYPTHLHAAVLCPRKADGKSALNNTWCVASLYQPPTVVSEGVHYDCGLELEDTGGIAARYRNAHRPPTNLRGHQFQMLCSIGGLCLSLLPGDSETYAALHGPVISKWQPMRKYLAEHTAAVFEHMQNEISLDARSRLLTLSLEEWYLKARSRQPFEVGGETALGATFGSRAELEMYEAFVHESIFLPTWSSRHESMNAFVEHVGQEKKIKELREFESTIIERPSLKPFLDALDESNAAEDDGNLSALHALMRNRIQLRHLQLVPDLVALYNMLHTILPNVITERQATERLTIHGAIELLGKRFPARSQEYEELWTRIKRGYAAVVKHLNGQIGLGACRHVAEAQAAQVEDGAPAEGHADDVNTIEPFKDTDALLLYLSTEPAFGEVRNDALYIMIERLCDDQNEFLANNVSEARRYGEVTMHQLSELTLLSGDLMLAEVLYLRNEKQTLPGDPDQQRLGSEQELQRIVRSYYKQKPDSPTTFEYDFQEIQKQALQLLVWSKPAIVPPNQLRSQFRFKAEKPTADGIASEDNSALAERVKAAKDELMRIPNIKRCIDAADKADALSFKQQCAYQLHAFYLSDLQTFARVLANLAQWTFMNRDMLGRVVNDSLIGEQKLEWLVSRFEGDASEERKEVLALPQRTPMDFFKSQMVWRLAALMEFAVDQIRDRAYDFADLSYYLKEEAPVELLQQLWDITHDPKCARKDIIDLESNLNEIESNLLKFNNPPDPLKSVFDYFGADESVLLVSAFPPELQLRHYVSVRQKLRLCLVDLAKHAKREEHHVKWQYHTEADRWVSLFKSAVVPLVDELEEASQNVIDDSTSEHSSDESKGLHALFSDDLPPPPPPPIDDMLPVTPSRKPSDRAAVAQPIFLDLKAETRDDNEVDLWPPFVADGPADEIFRLYPKDPQYDLGDGIVRVVKHFGADSIRLRAFASRRDVALRWLNQLKVWFGRHSRRRVVWHRSLTAIALHGLEGSLQTVSENPANILFLEAIRGVLAFLRALHMLKEYKATSTQRAVLRKKEYTELLKQLNTKQQEAMQADKASAANAKEKAKQVSEVAVQVQQLEKWAKLQALAHCEGNEMFEIKLVRALLESCLVADASAVDASKLLFNRFEPSDAGLDVLGCCQRREDLRAKVDAACFAYRESSGGFRRANQQQTAVKMVHRAFKKAQWQGKDSEFRTTAADIERRLKGSDIRLLPTTSQLELNNCRPGNPRERYSRLMVYSINREYETTVGKLIEMTKEERVQKGFDKEVRMESPFDQQVRSRVQVWLNKLEWMDRAHEVEGVARQMTPDAILKRLERGPRENWRPFIMTAEDDFGKLSVKRSNGEVICTAAELGERVRAGDVSNFEDVSIQSKYAEAARWATQEIESARMALHKANREMILCELDLFTDIKDGAAWIDEKVEKRHLDLGLPLTSHPILTWLETEQEAMFGGDGQKVVNIAAPAGREGEKGYGRLGSWLSTVSPVIKKNTGQYALYRSAELPPQWMRALRTGLADLRTAAPGEKVLSVPHDIEAWLIEYVAKHNEWPVVMHLMCRLRRSQLVQLIWQEYAALKATEESGRPKKIFKFTEEMEKLRAVQSVSGLVTSARAQTQHLMGEVAKTSVSDGERKAEIDQLMLHVRARCERFLELANSKEMPPLNAQLRRLVALVRALYDEPSLNRITSSFGDKIQLLLRHLGAALASFEAMTCNGVLERAFAAAHASELALYTSDRIYALHVELNPQVPRLPSAAAGPWEVAPLPQLEQLELGCIGLAPITISSTRMARDVHAAFEPSKEQFYYIHWDPALLGARIKPVTQVLISPAVSAYVLPTPIVGDDGIGAVAPRSPRLRGAPGGNKASFVAFVYPASGEQSILSKLSGAELEAVTQKALAGNTTLALLLFGGFAYLDNEGNATRVYGLSRGSALQFMRTDPGKCGLAALTAQRWCTRLPQLLPLGDETLSVASPAHIYDEVGWVSANDLEGGDASFVGGLAYKIAGKELSFTIASARAVELTLSAKAITACKVARGKLTKSSMTMWLGMGATVRRIQLVVADSFGIAFDEQHLTFAGIELNDSSKLVQDFLPVFVGVNSRIEVSVGLKDLQ